MNRETASNFNRRTMLRGMTTTATSAVASSLLMPGLLHQLLAEEHTGNSSSDPLAPKPTHFPARAKNVIFLFMTGGVSHVDTFDPKPQLVKDVGKEVKFDHPEIKDRPGYERIFLKRPQWEFSPHGECGTEVSTLFPHVATCVDDMAVIRSMHTSHSNHYNATLGMHTGSFAFARPSLGSWLSYGLGTENRNLPSFITIAPAPTYAGSQVYASDFLPGAHQGTPVQPGGEPIANVTPRVELDRQKRQLSILEKINQQHLAQREGDAALQARIRSFETAYGMQSAVPEVFDLRDETEATLNLYGLPRGTTQGFA